GVLASLDRLEQITTMEIRIAASHIACFFVGEALHALASVEVIFNPETLARVVNPHKCMGTIAVHVAPCTRQAPIAHEVGYLVCAFGVKRPEVPLHMVVA